MDLVAGDTVRTTGHGVVEGFLTGMPLPRAIGLEQPDTEAGADFADAMHNALGAALSHKATKDGKVSVVFWGKEVSPCWSHALEIARTHGLPMIFVRHSASENGRAPRTKLAKGEEIPGGPDDLGLPTITVDGNDVVAVYRVAHESIARARRGRGPTLIECGAFQPNGYNKGADSIAGMENYLRGKGLFKREMKTNVIEEFSRELDAAKKTARKAAPVS
jgi:pyruvate dehydrogenase E1 component alpha subunit